MPSPLVIRFGIFYSMSLKPRGPFIDLRFNQRILKYSFGLPGKGQSKTSIHAGQVGDSTGDIHFWPEGNAALIDFEDKAGVTIICTLYPLEWL